MQQNEPTTLDVIQRFNESFNRCDVDGVMAAMTEDCVVETPMPPPDGGRFQGQQAVRALWTGFFNATEDLDFQAEELICSGDRAVVRWAFRWSNPDGTPGHVRGIDLFRVRDGKVAEKLVYVKG